jgi:hypothetical protein
MVLTVCPDLPSRCGRVALGATIALLAGAPLPAQITRAERTSYKETSSYADVRAFLDSLHRRTNLIRVGVLATTIEGREVPYVVAARPLVSTPAEAHRSGKPIVYLQADIHGGEVEGKEAALMLLRDLTRGAKPSLLDSIVLLVVPINNPDGNDRWDRGERNRPGQNGPNLVGQNLNGQGLNLNRDYVKMEAPETRGAAALVAAWDPDLFVDLHTTNGSYHGYALTYAPGLNPNSNPASDFVRNRLLPQLRARMQQRHNQKTFSYGNFRNQHPDSLRLGWETYDSRPRFGTNWMGLRGRLAVLSEGYSNADFRSRVAATYNFVRELLGLVAADADTVKAVVQASSRQRVDSVAVRSELDTPTHQEVIAEITRELGEGNNGYARRQRTGMYRVVRMPVFDRFRATRKEAVPRGYLLPPRLKAVIDLLRMHAVLVDRLTTSQPISVEMFTVDSVIVGPLFEGHRTIMVEGGWSREPADTTISAGWYLVRTDQPLGILAAFLLEPASEDGMVTWNLLDREIRVRDTYPILRIRSSPTMPATAVP